MYLSRIMQNKEAMVRDEVNGGYSQTTMATGAHLLSPGETTKYPMGQKHIYLTSFKRSASNGTIFN